jgi:hypothetical protein
MSGPEPRVPTPGTFNVYAADQIVAAVKFVGGNAIGPQITVDLVNVMFRPTAAVGMIQDEWGQLTITGEVLADDTGAFGTVTHPDTTLVSPLVDLYYVGKGIVSIDVGMSGTFRDIGNVPTFAFTPNVTTLTHYSSRHGVRVKDLEVIHEKAATVEIVMDEFSYENMKLVLLGVDGP